jgi:hypothetical protein
MPFLALYNMIFREGFWRKKLKNAQKKGVPFLVQNRGKIEFFEKIEKNRVFFGANVGNYIKKTCDFSHVLKSTQNIMLLWGKCLSNYRH